MSLKTIITVSMHRELPRAVRKLTAPSKACKVRWWRGVQWALASGRRWNLPALFLVEIAGPDDARHATCLLEALMRRPSPAPMIMLVEEDTVETRLQWLERGAVDCLTLPRDVARLRMLIGMFTTCSSAGHPGPQGGASDPETLEARTADPPRAPPASLEADQPWMHLPAFDAALQLPSGNQLARARTAAERDRLLHALAAQENNRTRAAAELGISRVTLYKKLRRYGLLELPDP